MVALRTVGSKENPAPGTGLDCRLRGNDGGRKTRESPFRQAEPVEAWFLTAEGCGENAPAILFHPPFDKLRVTSRGRYAGTGLDCRLRGNDGGGAEFILAPFSI